ncbi:MAG: nuclease-related domain-containing protein [Angustibacter sp.]
MAEQLTTARWRKYGKDRLYVSTADGLRVGWVDLLTGDRVVERDDLEGPFTDAVHGWTAQSGVAIPGQQTPPAIADAAASAPPGAVHPSSPVPTPGPVQAPAPIQPTVSVSPVGPQMPTWVDLTLNVPGRAARQQAEAELAAQRERSRVGSFIARVVDMKTDERAWRVGAAGEETVGARLDKLTKRGWHILHAVPVGERGSDIDHIVIGHDGVYTLNTKTHPGGSVWVGQHQVRVNGHRTDYLRNSRYEGKRAARLLSAAVGFPVPVMPALVLLTGSLIPNVTIKQQPDGVFVYDRMDIPGVFKRAPERLTPGQVEAVFEQARRSSTWQRFN